MTEQYGFSIRGMIAEFYAVVEQTLAGLWVPRVAFPVMDSRQRIEHYRWLGMTPMLRQWIADRHPQNLNKDDYSLENLKYEATLDFEKDDLIEGLQSQIMIRVREMAQRANEHWEFLGSGVVSLGESALCYDGVSFFNAAHPGNAVVGNQKNLLTASDVPALNVAVAAAPTALEFAMAVLNCIAYMYSIRDDQNYPMNGAAKSFMLMVPVPLWAASVGPAFLTLGPGGGGAAETPLQMAAAKMGIDIEVVVNPFLTWTVNFAIFRKDAFAKALIMQQQYGPQTSIKGPGSEYEHDTDRNQFGVKVKHNIGYGYWQYAQKATLSHA